MTGTTGKRYFMNADKIRHLEKDGFTIGGHTWDHPILPQLNDERLQFQLSQSTSDLGAILGHRPTYFAYQDGVYDARVAPPCRRQAIKPHSSCSIAMIQ